MPNKVGLKLFTKTWPLKREKKDKEENQQRPLTATLEKPTILDIRFIDKIDMSIIRKEFLNISNLCKAPLIIRRRNTNRPLSLISSEVYNENRKKKRKTNSDNDGHEDDHSQIIRSAKIKSGASIRTKSSKTPNAQSFLINPLKKIQYNDANNNNQSLKVPSRKTTLTTIKQRSSTPMPLSNDLVKSSIKLPLPCKTCGRPDLPERFHSHPTTPLKSKKQNVLEIEKGILPVKSTVQKPIAIKYVSRSAVSAENKIPSPIKKHSSAVSANSLSATAPKTPLTKSKQNKDSSARCRQSSAEGENRTMRGNSGKRTLTCYICGREFGTASLHLHEPRCLEKWERENASLPANLRRKTPVKPDNKLSAKDFNQLAWESSQATLVPCKNCGRTFYPDRLMVHQRSCKATAVIKTKKSPTDSMAPNLSSSSPDSSSSAKSTKSNQPPTVECYICGKMFGTHSIKIHEKQCLKKWHTENETLPPDMRSPAPLKSAGKQPVPQQLPPEDKTPTASPTMTQSKDERPASGTRSPLFPCYLCGRLFTVNSIYIHEPQCLKMWKIENDKLPPNKRRPVPMKPDIKFTRSGKMNFEETTEAYWQSHLSQLVACKMCSRTFNPDRVAVHEKSCKGN